MDLEAEMSTGYMRRGVEKLKRACPPPLRRVLGRVLRIRNSVAFRLVARAHALANARQYGKAILAVKTAIRVQPRYVTAYELLAQLLTHVGRQDHALLACTEALQVNGQSEGILLSLQNILPGIRPGNRPNDIIRALDACLAVCPHQIGILKVLIELLFRSRRYREAVLACERLLNIDPDLISIAQIRENMINDPDAKPFLRGLDLATKSQTSDEYNRLVASNVTDLLIQVMARFYNNLGVDAASVPLIRALNGFRKKVLSEDVIPSEETPSTLIRFERAWATYRSGQIAEALRSFEMIFNDASAWRRMEGSPFLKEAVIRSGEIWGRHQEKIGKIDLAIATYRQIIAIDANGVIARRLLLLLSRKGSLREASNLAEMSIINRINLYPYLPENPYIAALKKEMSATPSH